MPLPVALLRGGTRGGSSSEGRGGRITIHLPTFLLPLRGGTGGRVRGGFQVPRTSIVRITSIPCTPGGVHPRRGLGYSSAIPLPKYGSYKSPAVLVPVPKSSPNTMVPHACQVVVQLKIPSPVLSFFLLSPVLLLAIYLNPGSTHLLRSVDCASIFRIVIAGTLRSSGICFLGRLGSSFCMVLTISRNM